MQKANWKTKPRYWRDDSGQYRRVAYRRVEICYHVGGRGPTPRTRFQVWNTDYETWTEAGEAAAPGEQFGLVLTEEEFESKTYPPEHLPPIGRKEARRKLTSRPGAERFVRFVKRGDGSLRYMRFRYDPSGGQRYGFDPKTKGLLPVHDLDKNAPRMVNLDGVRTVA